MEDAKAKKFDALVIYKWDRLARIAEHPRILCDDSMPRKPSGYNMRSNSWFRSQSYDLDATHASSPLVAVEFE